MPQLDGVRGVAILLVLIQHWFHWSWGMISGRAGVILFFILSGYFITAILLKLRSRIETGDSSTAGAFKAFYSRRALRIFPAFYLVLLLAYVAGVTDVRDYLAWHAAYLSNFLFAARGDWLPNTAHFWSLAVEEQYYLVWPLVIWWTPRRWLLPVIAASMATAPLARLAIPLLGFHPLAAETMPFCVTDALGLGGLLACMRSPDYSSRSRGLRRFVVVAAPAGFAAYWVLYVRSLAPAWADTFTALAFGALVLVAIEARQAGIVRALSFRPLAYLGRISYGVYLIHLPITHAIWLVTSRVLPAGASIPQPALVATWAVATIGLAALSWRFFERPLLALAPTQAPVAAVGAQESQPGARSAAELRPQNG